MRQKVLSGGHVLLSLLFRFGLSLLPALHFTLGISKNCPLSVLQQGKPVFIPLMLLSFDAEIQRKGVKEK